MCMEQTVWSRYNRSNSRYFLIINNDLLQCSWLFPLNLYHLGNEFDFKGELKVLHFKVLCCLQMDGTTLKTRGLSLTFIVHKQNENSSATPYRKVTDRNSWLGLNSFSLHHCSWCRRWPLCDCHTVSHNLLSPRKLLIRLLLPVPGVARRTLNISFLTGP